MDSTYLVEGVVVDTADPQEMGRLKVWIPAIDGDNYQLETLPWVRYVSPMAGRVIDYPAGAQRGIAQGPLGYGFWAIPKVGAIVLIGFLYGDFNQRIYMGSMFRDHGNRGLPAGRNTAEAPETDSFDPIEPTLSNLKTQFNNDLTNSIARTRGAYERQVAQAADNKTDEEGYSTRQVPADPNPAGSAGALDPQTYCITTPGRHSLIMQDDPQVARVRIKTAEGSQIIIDDANERIYVSTSRGKTWIELDQDGHVHIYGSESISMSAGKDFNLQALGSVNISAGKNVNIGAGGWSRISACGELSLSADGSTHFTSGGTMHLMAASQLLQQGSQIHLNGPAPTAAPCAEKPTIVPSHEPWDRPPTPGTRNKNWKA